MRVVIWGLGRSGWGSLILALKHGYEVMVSESGILDQATRRWLEERHVEYEEGNNTSEFLSRGDVIVKSPGIPPSHPLMKHEHIARNVISDIEWAYMHSKGKIIAVTGTNGKSTTTRLIAHILQHAGLDVAFSGNIGKSFALQVAEHDAEWHVVEVSSFQLAYIRDFKPEIAIILTISPDHLDWHPSMDHYVWSKVQISRNQDSSDFLLLGPSVRKYVADYRFRAKTIWVEWKETRGRRIRILYNKLSDMKIDFDLWKKAIHPVNAVSAILSAHIAGVGKSKILEALSTFKGLPHRMEIVGELNGVVFINDSKATNVESTVTAFQLLDFPVIWIAGGYEKGEVDYSNLMPHVKQKAVLIVHYGKKSPVLKKTFSKEVPMVEAEDLSEAVHIAWQYAMKGTTILFSPACASFDQFRDYRERGEVFCRIVWDLIESELSSAGKHRKLNS